MKIPMTYADVIAVTAIAQARMAANLKTGHIPAYKAVLLPQRIAEPATAMCEWAVAKMLDVNKLPTLWHRSNHADNKQEADVGPIEVRWVREKGNMPWVRTKDAGRWVVGCYCDPNGDLLEVEILGAIYVTDDMAKWLEHNTEFGSKAVKPESLQPITDELLQTLKDICREAPPAAPTVAS